MTLRKASGFLIATLGVLGVFATLLWILLILFGVSVQSSDGDAAKAGVYLAFAACALIGLVCFAAAAANSSEKAPKSAALLGAGCLAVGAAVRRTCT